MAFFATQKRMVYWKFIVNGRDETAVFGKNVASIHIKDSILPSAPTRKKDKSFPPGSEAVITFVEKDYFVDWFVQGTKIQIFMGYERLSLPKVFEGTVMTLPDGRAREMLDYSVKAYGGMVGAAFQQKARVFPIPQKSAVIAQIASENGWIPDIQIADTSVIPADQIPMSKGFTDLEILIALATIWDCVLWFEDPNILHFIDSDRAHDIYDSRYLSATSLTENGSNFFAGKPGPYELGYRTDLATCNVESVIWKHMNQKGGGAGSPSYVKYTEDGFEYDFKAFKIPALGQTWQMKPEYARSRDASKIFSWIIQAAQGTINQQGYQVLRKYYRIVPNSKTRPDDATHVGAGFEITVMLNEGDPYLRPPRNANLYAGSINPRADSSYLPAWFYRHSPGFVPPAKLKINQVELMYNTGRLSSKLKCSMSMFPGGL